ncbi:phosphotransferase [Rheinheimera baltica]|uniref:choline/ethanolamine kinase family protein n=1 Tax=Rheinheimera baltica TaxID=67576 RepID=UPI00273D04BD|nr:phosphotransferase [Rheinheimera baltica]MDP5142780.1 phosphotransferase [Rheinheimera baltica]MDP5149545.1 phosphotransferase [Rheinheimera baltica]
MAQSLSAAASSEIERVTRLCQRLEFFVSQPPLQVKPLSHGESNQSYYVKTARGEYVLRCYPADSMVCRQQELRCQHAAAAQNLAPPPLCLNNHYQIMLSEYIPLGVAFDYNLHGATVLLTALAKFHQLSVQTPLLECSVYLQQLVMALPESDKPDAELVALLCNAAEQMHILQSDTVLCHLDLHADNILFAGQQLWLLDFEYSQLADSSLDLAAISLHFNLTPAQEMAMLQEYVGLRQQSELNTVIEKKLIAAKRLYCGFCWLWYLAIPGYQQQAKRWQQRLLQLSV